ncbi:MAG: hypothetical protein J7M24_07810 [Candidatus Latescibacteria bacterium]|nr:hypothetical protein [Candidatus Latescibacterota bacterium]
MKYPLVKKLLQGRIGLKIEALGEALVDRVIASEIHRLGLDSDDWYHRVLQTTPEAFEMLTEQVVVHETWFFRDTAPFNLLKKHVEENKPPAGRRDGILKVLSAPCSTGEEPYSIAITFLEAGLPPHTFSIDAVDISKRGIVKAVRGVFRKESFRGVDDDHVNRYFQFVDQAYLLDERIRRHVRFHEGNLLDTGFISGFMQYNIIFFRNFMIYLTDKARLKVLRAIDSVLVPGGLLFTGHAELSIIHQFGYDPVEYPRSFALRKPARPLSADAGNAKAITKAKPSRPKRSVSQGTVVTVSRKEPATPSVPEPTISEVRKLADRGELEKAYSLCDRIIERSRAHAEAFFIKGVIDNALDRYQSAENNLRKSLFLDPDYYEALIHLSLLYEQRGDTIKCDAYRRRARRLHEGKMKLQRRGDEA